MMLKDKRNKAVPIQLITSFVSVKMLRILLLACSICLLGLHTDSTVGAQGQVSPTPVNVVLPTATPQATDITIATTTPTFTPQPEGPTVVRAIRNEFDQPVNVRRLPDPTAEVVGTLDFDIGYVLTGRYFSWWRIEFDNAPGGVGYVFESVVEVDGSEIDIPEIDPFSGATGDGAVPDDVDENDSGETTTDSDDRTLQIPTPDTSRSLDIEPELLPTFTYPPDAGAPPTVNQDGDSAILQAQSADNALSTTISTVTSGNIPPIFPIALLGGFGLLGLVVGLIRR